MYVCSNNFAFQDYIFFTNQEYCLIQMTSSPPINPD
jgi:hypothetical protein